MALLIQLLLVVVFISCIIWAVGLIPLPPPGQMIARAIIGVVALVWLLHMAGAFGAPWHLWHA